MKRVNRRIDGRSQAENKGLTGKKGLSGGRSILLPAGLLIAALFTVFFSAQSGGAAGVISRNAPSAADGGPAYGISFINQAELLADERQFANGLAAGAAWDRYPLYWFYIEKSPGVFDWSRQDAAVKGTVEHGLQLDAILLGTPAFYTTNLLQSLQFPYQHPQREGTLSLTAVETARPLGLDEPVFTDGDAPGPNRTINPNNKWAVFVETAVKRYKPGGLLAQANSWPQGVGVSTWEMWNEADLSFFWDASLNDYARLLKVGYLAAKHADPGAQVMFGGLAMWQNQAFYDQVLTVFDGDSLAPGQGYYHDVMAIHNYSNPERSGAYTERVSEAMKKRGLDMPIWLNEAGVPAWDDYPGPTWEPLSPLRATQQEQANFTIQSAFYALSAGADALFYFQLYDGCGNQPAGTDFPPHNGELCDANNNYNGKPCAGDAYGLYRNPSDAACFRQHPQPESPRPAFAAYKTLTSYVHDVEPYWRTRAGAPHNTTTCPGADGPQEWIALYQPAAKKRIVGLWTRCGRKETTVIEATDPQGTALLVAADGTSQEIHATNGSYTITLPAATNRNPLPGQTINPVYGMGGEPLILIEHDYRDEAPTPTATSSSPPTATATSTSSCGQNMISNGDFEAATGWTLPSTAYPAAYSGDQAHTGSLSLRAGITRAQDNVFSYSTARQTVTAPTGSQDSLLRFWLYTRSSETTALKLPADLLALDKKDAAAAGDYQMVLILDSSGAVLERLIVDRLNDQAWQPYRFDLSRYAGRTIQVYFGVYNNGSGGVTAMYVDDVSLGSCAQATPVPTATPAATATLVPGQVHKSFMPAYFYDYPLGISGKISRENGPSLPEITVELDSGQRTISDAGGIYSFNDLQAGTYVIRPQKEGYDFQPALRTVTLPPGARGQDFIALPASQDPYPGRG